MNDELLRQLVRQVKILNVWVSIFGTLVLITLVTLVVVLFKVATFVNHTAERLTNIQTQTQQSLDLKSKLCDNKTLSSYIGASSDLCK